MADKTKEELIAEIKLLHARVAELETLRAARKEIAAGLEKTRKEVEIIKKIADEAGEFAESIINTVQRPLIALDQDLRVVKVSRSFYDFFKVKPEETMGQLIYDLGNKQWDIPKLRELLETILPDKTTFDNYEVEHDFAGVGRRIMLLNARQIQRVLGKERIILLAIEDITERKRLQEKMEVSEERFRRAFETSQNVLLLVNKTQGNILNFNESAQKLFGYSKEEFLEKKLWELGVIKGPEEFQAVVAKSERDGTVHYEEILVKTKQGLGVSAEVFLVDREKVVQCNIRDITDRKKADEALRESEEKYRILIQTLPYAVFEVDAQGKIVFVSDGIKQLGYSSQELTGKNFEEIVHPDDFEIVSRVIVLPKYKGTVTGDAGSPKLFDEQRTSERITRHLQIRLLRKSQNSKPGDFCYCEIDSTGKWDKPPEDKNKNFLGSIGIIQDITERKNMEKDTLKRLYELEVFYKAGIGREERILELKKEIEELKTERGTK